MKKMKENHDLEHESEKEQNETKDGREQNSPFGIEQNVNQLVDQKNSIHSWASSPVPTNAEFINKRVKDDPELRD